MGGLGNSKFTQEIAIAVQHKMYLSNYTPFFFLFGKLTSVKWGFINGIWLGRIKKKSLPLMHVADYGKSGFEFLCRKLQALLLVIGELRADIVGSISS